LQRKGPHQPISNEHKNLFQSILTEETKMDHKRLKKGRKRGNQKILSSTLVSHHHQQIIQRETVHQFGQTWGYAASDIRILDTQFSNIRFQTENMITKILNGYQVT
jgi:hypothetical protein